MKKLFTVRKILSFFLAVSLIFTAYSAYYKIKFWGFDIKPNKITEVWTIDAHISFKALGKDVNVSLATPSVSKEFKVLNEDIIAKNYTFSKDEKTGRIKFQSSKRKGRQNIYYRLTVYDNEDTRGKVRGKEPEMPEPPLFDEQQLQMAEEILQSASVFEGSLPQKLILLFNQSPLDETVEAFLPVKASLHERANIIIDLLSLQKIPARLVRGVKLVEGKKASNADLMLEAYEGNRWRLYDLQTAKDGLPKNFILFQRGGVSLLDVEGGERSTIKFSVLKSVTSSFEMAEHRAEMSSTAKLYNFSIYRLPLLEQNILKWLMVFPLGILVVVFMRNVVGVPTMGTFTPMLIAMSFVQTGLSAGLVCFSIILFIGIALRSLLSKLNLLLVPRISSVVIFVILIIQTMTVIGYHFELEISSAAVFFPIIITAWIIERLSIIWEEEGAKNAVKEMFWTTVTALATYFVIASETIRHFMFAFNEVNLVILFVVMLLGTYTGYRLTELKRFYPLVKEK
ncbi:MAG: UUP1 family membrane protein [Alphaproteobacteria bacterium]|nr:UUP1 family membrane protein [Alphaproteobacteria bacterium]